MNQSDPLSQLARLAEAEASKREAERQRVRAICPVLTAIMDELKPHARMLHITVDGVTVAGRPPKADPPSWVELSGDCVVALCNFGRKR